MRRWWLQLVCVTIAVVVAGCSGGGSTSAPAPGPTPTLGGSGSTAAINQKIAFSIIVPAPAPAGSSRNRAPRGAAASPPYLSPATAAIVLTLAEINGVSPQKAPPVIPPIAVTCQGCTFSVPNIPAALGVDRYFVQTYSAYTNGQATGNLISTGFVDVAVPVKTPPAIGGAAALSVGGYVAQISLAPASFTFTQGVAADADLLVRALDAGGATIVGSVQYVSPIVVSVVDAQNFKLDGAVSESIPGTLARPIVLHYSGGNSFGTFVNATSQDENGATVNAPPVAAFVVTPTPLPGASPSPGSSPTPVGSPTPTPHPTLGPSPTPPPATTSLYVADTSNDTVSEYGFVAQLESGHIPNPIPTPRRVMQFDPALVPIPLFACGQSPFFPVSTGNGNTGVAVGGDGTIYTFPTCYDGPGNVYIFGFPATSVGPVKPTIQDPISGAPYPTGLTYNPVVNFVFGEYFGIGYDYPLAGFAAKSNGRQPSINIGTSCFQEFGQPPCGPNNNTFIQDTNFTALGFAIDSNGFAYVPAQWGDNPATGDASNLNLPGAVLVAPSAISSSATHLQASIAGLNSLVGGGPPVAVAVDGSTLYVLSTGASLQSADGNTNYYSGLSNCPMPSSNAPVNTTFTIDPNTGSQIPPVTCTDGFQHNYLSAYTINGSLLGPGGYGMEVDLVPNFVIGGDIVGKFGCSTLQNGTAIAGQFLAASAGYVYIVNPQPNCNNPTTPEIDVYNTNGLLGVHTDIAPAVTIGLPNGFPIGVTIGPSGTVTGGQAVYRLPRSPGFHKYLHHWPALRHRQTRSAFRRPAR